MKDPEAIELIPSDDERALGVREGVFVIVERATICVLKTDDGGVFVGYAVASPTFRHCDPLTGQVIARGRATDNLRSWRERAANRSNSRRGGDSRAPRCPKEEDQPWVKFGASGR